MPCVRRRIPIPIRIQVWYREFGNCFFGTCPVCNTSVLNPLTFECGHKISRAKGGRVRTTNLRPICGSCNRSMNSKKWSCFTKRLNTLRTHLQPPKLQTCRSFTLPEHWFYEFRSEIH